MTFSEFAQKLYPVIGGGCSTHAFTRSIFEEMIYDDGLKILDDYSDESFKAYFNGTTKITRLAQRIMPYADRLLFSDFIKRNFDDAPVETLCNTFKNDIPDIEPLNAVDKIADFFYSIIENAAVTKKKHSAMNQKNSEKKTIDTEVVDDKDADRISEDGKKETIIQQQTNVIQNGETNINLTNNGTINFDLKGDL